MTTPADLLDLTATAGGPALWAVITEGRPLRAGPPPFGPAPAELRHLHRDGVLVLMAGDAYAPADRASAPGIRAAAAALVVPPGTVLTGVAAAWVHGVGGPSLSSVCGDPGLDVISPPGLMPRPKSRDWLRIRQFALSDDDRIDLDGLAVTTPARTAVDLARLTPPAVALDVLTRLAPATGLLPEELQRTVDRMARFPGLATVRQLIAAWRDQQPTGSGTAPAKGQRSPERLPVTR